MTKITAIKAQVKHPDRFSIFIGGSYRLSLDALELSASGLATGQEITDEDIRGLEETGRYNKALRAAFNLLSYRSRSQSELRLRLIRKNHDQTLIERVIRRLLELKLLDDDEFAAGWVAKSSHKSQNRVKQELLHKGIENSAIDQQLAEDPDHDKAAIKHEINKRLLKSAPEKRKLIEFLARRGFRYRDVMEVLGNDFSGVDWLPADDRPLRKTTTTIKPKPYNSLQLKSY